MAKQNGLGDNLLVAGYDLSGDIGSIERVAGGNSPLDVTGINASAHERRGGLRDGGIDYTAWFNPSANQAHDRLEDLPTSDQVVTYLRGTNLNSPAASIVAKQINYDGTRGNDGSLSFNVQSLANGFGLEWGQQLTAGLDLIASAQAGTGVDFGGATALGLQAYLQVTLFSGTSATVAIQDNTVDNPGTYADVTGAVFTAATGITSQRIETARNQAVRQWLRVNVTGTFSALVFCVQVVKNDVSVVF